ncbi:hypothetical protein SASPL_106598 [Salvia splendens]|uniref:FLZ-type domain-containing protein n=1 Tax=Salvia splendens TaxID=180675 RepID=A0A8X9AB16_SALSN|nr:hypothetical protein SASPL_106598 [Salvia splendens]
MPVKRSRAGRSSACLDAAPGKLTKSDASADAAPPKLLHVASPVNTPECAADRTKIGGFLERCHYCNKRIAQNSDVFMYRQRELREGNFIMLCLEIDSLAVESDNSTCDGRNFGSDSACVPHCSMKHDTRASTSMIYVRFAVISSCSTADCTRSSL